MRFEKLQLQPRTPGSLPANGAAGRPCPVSGDIRPGCSGSYGARGPDLWESSRAQPEAPLSARSDKPFPRRPAPAQPRAPDGPRGPSRPPRGADSARPPHPGPGAPRGDRLTGATLAHTPGRPLLPAAPHSPARASSRQARRVRPLPPVTAPSPGGARGAGRGGRTWRALRWPAARRGVSLRGLAWAGGRLGLGTLPASIPGSEVPARPRLARRGGPTSAPLRTPALLPPPYGNLQPQKVTRRRFLGLSARPPPPGQRSCRGDSGRGSGFLGQNLLGRLGRARGEGEPGNHCPDFFFPHQERIYPFLSLLQTLASCMDERGPGDQ